MRTALAFGLLAMLCPPVVLAQTNAVPSPAAPSSPATPSSPAAPSSSAVVTPAAPTRGHDITRDEYIQRAVDRARRSAEKRFDQMDTDHDGVLTAEERRAYRAQRRAARAQSQ